MPTTSTKKYLPFLSIAKECCVNDSTLIKNSDKVKERTMFTLLYMLGVVADLVAIAKYRLRSIVRNDKSRC